MQSHQNILAVVCLLAGGSAAWAEHAIEFPDASIGLVFVAPADSVRFGYQAFVDSNRDGWTKLGEARGAVSIPMGHVVRVELQPGAAPPLDWVEQAAAQRVVDIEAYDTPISDAGFERLSRLANLQWASLSRAGLSSAIAEHLPRLTALRYLWLGSNEGIGDEAMPAIAELPKLESIGVFDTSITDAGLEAIANSRSLRAVYAGYTAITDEGLRSLSRLADLRVVHALAPNPEFGREGPVPTLTDQGVTALAPCKNMEHLNLSGAELTDNGLHQVAESFPNLRRLEIDHTRVTSEGLKQLGKLTRLESLRCYGTRIDDSVVGQFVGLNRLREISGDVEISIEGVKTLTSLPSFESLSVEGASVGDDCLPQIAAMPTLRELRISNTKITDEGFAKLAGSPTIERVQLTGGRLTTRCVETLATMPNLRDVGLMSIDPRQDGEPTWQGLSGLESLDQELWLCMCPPLSRQDLAAVARLAQLSQLRIDGGGLLTDDDLRLLKGLQNLTYLELTNTEISDDGLGMIADLPRLERLLIHCVATPEGLATLARAPHLKYVSIGSPAITVADVERVQAMPSSRVSIHVTPFRLGNAEVSRSKNDSDDFWRKGLAGEREALNVLEGKLAPPLTVTEWLNAQPDASLDIHAGKVVLIDFWGTWCGPCLRKIPEMRRLHEEYRDRGLVVIGLHSTQQAGAAAAYVAENKIDWPIGLDDEEKTSTAYAVPHWPSIYLIDRKGVLRMAGLYDGSLEAAVQALLDE